MSIEDEAPRIDIFGRASGTATTGMVKGTSPDEMLAVISGVVSSPGVMARDAGVGPGLSTIVGIGGLSAKSAKGSLRDWCRRWATSLPNWRCSPNSVFLGGAGGWVVFMVLRDCAATLMADLDPFLGWTEFDERLFANQAPTFPNSEPPSGFFGFFGLVASTGMVAGTAAFEVTLWRFVLEDALRLFVGGRACMSSAPSCSANGS